MPRSSMLGGRVVAEVSWTGTAWQWSRGYVYLGSQLLAVQSGGPKFVHEDPVTKSKRLTDLTGALVSAIEQDPWGADTNRSSNAAFQPRRFTSYERGANGGEEAMFRRYHRGRAAFDQPDPYGGSYNFTDPQSFNRYSYVQNDPVNFTDPTGLQAQICWDVGGDPWFGGNEGWFTTCIDAPDPWGGFFPPDRPVNDGGGEQEPAKPSHTPPNDCEAFADIVEQIANSLGVHLAGSDDLSGTVQRFMDALATRFTEYRGASRVAGVLRMFGSTNESHRPGEFGSSGFAAPYFEQNYITPSGRRVPMNQVRHAVGGLLAGYVRGERTGLDQMNGLENRNDPRHGVPDINLNNQTVPMGARIAGPDGYAWAAALDTWIRETLCAD